MQISFIHKTFLKKWMFRFVLGPIIFYLALPLPLVRAQSVGGINALQLPAVGSMLPLTEAYHPALIKGISLHPQDPFLFDFIVHPGDVAFSDDELNAEAQKMVKYFLAALTVPEQEMWVNLSPYEKDRIIPESFGATEMGRDLLAQDYILKQMMASLMYPEEELGSEFWNKVYAEAYQKYGTTDIPLDTFNKVWIVPERAVIHENGMNVFVVDMHLKVLTEADYLASKQYAEESKKTSAGEKSLATDYSVLPTEVLKEVVIPALEREVNEGQTFAPLRQISNAVILATWYKRNVMGSFLNDAYVNQKKVAGVETQDKQINQKIYERYLSAFKQGVYDYIKEEYDPVGQEVIPRHYFSGGVKQDWTLESAKEDFAISTQPFEGSKNFQVRLVSAQSENDFEVMKEDEDFAAAVQAAEYVQSHVSSFPSLSLIQDKLDQVDFQPGDVFNDGEETQVIRREKLGFVIKIYKGSEVAEMLTRKGYHLAVERLASKGLIAETYLDVDINIGYEGNGYDISGAIVQEETVPLDELLNDALLQADESMVRYLIKGKVELEQKILQEGLYVHDNFFKNCGVTREGKVVLIDLGNVIESPSDSDPQLHDLLYKIDEPISAEHRFNKRGRIIYHPIFVFRLQQNKAMGQRLEKFYKDLVGLNFLDLSDDFTKEDIRDFENGIQKDLRILNPVEIWGMPDAIAPLAEKDLIYEYVLRNKYAEEFIAIAKEEYARDYRKVEEDFSMAVEIRNPAREELTDYYRNILMWDSQYNQNRSELELYVEVVSEIYATGLLLMNDVNKPKKWLNAIQSMRKKNKNLDFYLTMNKVALQIFVNTEIGREKHMRQLPRFQRKTADEKSEDPAMAVNQLMTAAFKNFASFEVAEIFSDVRGVFSESLVSTKNDGTLKTITDELLQIATILKLHELFPEDGFVGEEYLTDQDINALLGHLKDYPKLQGKYQPLVERYQDLLEKGALKNKVNAQNYPVRLWVSDPLDGTREFSQGGDRYSWSIFRLTWDETKQGYIPDYSIIFRPQGKIDYEGKEAESPLIVSDLSAKRVSVFEVKGVGTHEFRFDIKPINSEQQKWNNLPINMYNSRNFGNRYAKIYDHLIGGNGSVDLWPPTVTGSLEILLGHFSAIHSAGASLWDAAALPAFWILGGGVIRGKNGEKVDVLTKEDIDNARNKGRTNWIMTNGGEVAEVTQKIVKEYILPQQWLSEAGVSSELTDNFEWIKQVVAPLLKKFKLIITDLDDSIIDGKSPEGVPALPQETAQVIDRIRAKEILLSAVTGKPVGKIPFNFSDELSAASRANQYLATENGARIYQFDAQGNLDENSPVRTIAFPNDPFLVDYVKSVMQEVWDDVIKAYPGINPEMPFQTIEDEQGNILGLKILNPNDPQTFRAELGRKMRERFQSNPRTHAVKALESSIAVNVTYADKGDAVKYLLEKLGIAQEDVLILGDSTLDDPMYKALPESTRIYLGQTPYAGIGEDVIHFPVSGHAGGGVVLNLVDLFAKNEDLALSVDQKEALQLVDALTQLEDFRKRIDEMLASLGTSTFKDIMIAFEPFLSLRAKQEGFRSIRDYQEYLFSDQEGAEDKRNKMFERFKKASHIEASTTWLLREAVDYEEDLVSFLKEKYVAAGRKGQSIRIRHLGASTGEEVSSVMIQIYRTLEEIYREENPADVLMQGFDQWSQSWSFDVDAFDFNFDNLARLYNGRHRFSEFGIGDIAAYFKVPHMKNFLIKEDSLTPEECVESFLNTYFDREGENLQIKERYRKLFNINLRYMDFNDQSQHSLFTQNLYDVTFALNSLYYVNGPDGSSLSAYDHLLKSNKKDYLFVNDGLLYSKTEEKGIRYSKHALDVFQSQYEIRQVTKTEIRYLARLSGILGTAIVQDMVSREELIKLLKGILTREEVESRLDQGDDLVRVLLESDKAKKDANEHDYTARTVEWALKKIREGKTENGNATSVQRNSSTVRLKSIIDEGIELFLKSQDFDLRFDVLDAPLTLSVKESSSLRFAINEAIRNINAHAESKGKSNDVIFQTSQDEKNLIISVQNPGYLNYQQLRVQVGKRIKERGDFLYKNEFGEYYFIKKELVEMFDSPSSSGIIKLIGSHFRGDQIELVENIEDNPVLESEVPFIKGLGYSDTGLYLARQRIRESFKGDIFLISDEVEDTSTLQIVLPLVGLGLGEDFALSVDRNGGIDLNPENINIEINTKDSKIHFLPYKILPGEKDFPGLKPVILQVSPLSNIPQMLGIQ